MAKTRDALSVQQGSARKGLQVRRLFTTEGVHPYDELTWERRDAVITNWRDGSTAFEQRDLDFPSTWSQNATNIVAQKYFRGPLGTPQREHSVRQMIDRVAVTITNWGAKDGYFASQADAEAFRAELTRLLVNQEAAFNSPVWFNVGVEPHPQCSACFILSIEDTMPSILNWYVEEGLIFKGGSGAGINLSTIRSSREPLGNGGEASGPVSFMRGADSSAGTIKSGGKTRRAAKMVVLNVDHPDVRDFIWCKAREEHKARVLRDAGFDMDLDGRDSISIQYQNANNSVRVTDEFMHAYESDGEFDLKAVLDGHVIERTRARELMREIAQAAWECADPGMQYDTTINDWHTTPESGRINASNPCFTGETLVQTDKGLIRFDELARRAVEGETFGIYTHDATNPDAPSETVTLSRHEAVMVTGVNPVVRLTFSNGAQVRCTPNHRFWTADRGWVAARDLEPTDGVRLLDHSTPADAAERLLPVPTEVAAYASKGDHSAPMALPEKWDPDFAHLLGWLVGDGSFSGDVISAIYGSAEDREAILPRHQRLFSELNGGREPKLSVHANGTVQLRLSRRALALFFEALGLKRVKAAEKDVPWSIFQAPTDIVCAFLRGLFDADGTVVNQKSNATRYVGLGSRSLDLLRSVQALLSSYGITSRIYTNGKGGPSGFTYTGRDGAERSYSSAIGHDLRIAGADADRFAAMVGFELPSKAARLTTIADAAKYQKARVAKLVSRRDDGFEVTYNLSEPKNHSYIVQGMIVANCSEYMHLDNSACNLASLNLLKFLGEDAVFDVERFKHAVEIVFLAQEIIVGNSSYPTEKITRNAKDYRQLGLGYANLGALLMAQGQSYDSDGGRAWAGAITALMTGHAYRTSARVAQVTGPFAGYPKNREPMLRVIRKHRKAVDDIDAKLVQPSLLDAARTAWDEALKFGEEHGFRNAQASVIAPTGCLTSETLVTTDRGLVRLGELGDARGAQWQDLALNVSTDDGPRQATKFFINGEEPTRRIVTESGYTIQGTLRHRIKVIDPDTGEWVWRQLVDIQPDDVVPLQLGTIIGEPGRVLLPVLDEAYWTGERGVRVPDHVNADLAELVGYFMGDGSLHAKGLRFCVADTDLDVIERLRVLGKELFGIEAAVSQQSGYHEVSLHSVRLARWWEASGFSKHLPGEEHTGKGWEPHVPSAILESNDREVYGAFLRGLFEADGSIAGGVPSLSTASERFASELRSVLLVLGIPSTTRLTYSGWGAEPISQVRVRNLDFVPSFTAAVGFISSRKARACAETISVETGGVRLQAALGYVFEQVAANEDGGIQPTYDLSVPDNVTYVASGFVSHNTIGLLMDCDTTGIEPDLALVKTKKLVGGGSMSIVNQTVPRALRRLGYAEEHVQAILEYIAERNSVKGAPALRTEHHPVFDCAIGDSPIHYMGHIRMMAAVQPFISGALSKCVTSETLIPTTDGLIRIGSLHEAEPEDSFRDEILAVASLDGLQKTDAFYYGGVRTTRKVVLRSGHKIVGTPNHRLLVATDHGLEWRELADIGPGDYVAQQYGADVWSSLPARFDDFVSSPRYGSQKTARIPDQMTQELAFLLGAFAAEGHITRSNYTIVITNSVESVLERVAAAWRTEFDVACRIARDPGKCPAVIVSSKEIVEFLDYLGCGGRASEKRIPDAVLRSSRSMVLSFLQGLALDGYVTLAGMPKWAICLDAPKLLDDLQAVLTNLGIVHGRTTKYNPKYAKSYEEIYTCGEYAQRLLEYVPFCEPEKAARAARLAGRTFAQSTAEIIPGLKGPELYDAIPKGKSGRNGWGVRSKFAFLLDPRTRHVSRRTLERVAAIPGVELPDWLRMVLQDRLHFSPVAHVADVGEREVFDLSVPTVHAFVGNGIVNHNTVNMPESVTVEEVERAYYEGWKLGLKALAIYRDNCKVGQPLSATKSSKVVETAEAAGEAKAAGTEATAAAAAGSGRADRRVVTDTGAVIEVESAPVRRRLPRTRPSRTTSFRVGDIEGYMTAGSYPDDGLGEIFVKVSKQGSTLSGVMDAFAIAVSLGLQYGVPLEVYVAKFSNMIFEPNGITDDPDIRITQSLVDYIARRLAIDYLDVETRRALGIKTTAERIEEVNGGTTATTAAPPAGETTATTGTGSAAPADQGDASTASGQNDTADATDGAGAGGGTGQAAGPEPQAVAPPSPRAELSFTPGMAAVDAPFCSTCGVRMRPAGSCFVCESCGTTSGCS